MVRVFGKHAKGEMDDVMDWYKEDVQVIEKKLGSNLQKGLSDKQAEKKLKKYGPNQLEEQEEQSALLMFLAQFNDFMVIILLAATFISGLLGD